MSFGLYLFISLIACLLYCSLFWSFLYLYTKFNWVLEDHLTKIFRDFTVFVLHVQTQKALPLPILVKFSVTNIEIKQSEQRTKLVDFDLYKSIECESKAHRMIAS